MRLRFFVGPMFLFLVCISPGAVGGLGSDDQQIPLKELTSEQRQVFSTSAGQLRKVISQLSQIKDISRPEKDIVIPAKREIQGSREKILELSKSLPSSFKPVKANLERLDVMMVATVGRLDKIKDEKSLENALIISSARTDLNEAARVWTYYSKAANGRVLLECSADVERVQFRYRTRYCHEHPDECGKANWINWAPGTRVDIGDYYIAAVKDGYKENLQFKPCVDDPTVARFIMESNR